MRGPRFARSKPRKQDLRAESDAAETAKPERPCCCFLYDSSPSYLWIRVILVVAFSVVGILTLGGRHKNRNRLSQPLSIVWEKKKRKEEKKYRMLRSSLSLSLFRSLLVECFACLIIFRW
jgi:hypothetical protein